VASFCGLLQRRYAAQLDERAQQYIAFAVDGARRMQRLVDGLLEFSRVGRAGDAASPGPGELLVSVDLDRLVATQVAHLNLGSEAARATVRWHRLPVVRGNEVLIGRLLANLINNGVKFHRPGAPATVTLSARRLGAFWEVSCVDDGIGIPQDRVETAFAIFGRLHGRDAYPGTGMGLAIAKRIVEHHGGTIWIDSAHTPGAAVRFTLPAVPASRQTVNDPLAERSVAPTATATASASGTTSD
jgi:light-regulated signal transduction histidine kinase (bacteriophytochrome)